MQMESLSCRVEITGGFAFVNIRQTYFNQAGTGCSVFRFNLPEKAFVSKLDIKTPGKHITTEYISLNEAEQLNEEMKNGASPITLDRNGIFTAVIGAINPEETADISFTYIQRISPYSGIKLTVPIKTGEKLSPQFQMDAKIKWSTADEIVYASGSHETVISGKTAELISGYIPDKDIILEMRAGNCSLCNVYKGSQSSLLDICLPYEPLRTEKSYEYLFVTDVSKGMREHWENVKNALLSCICALEPNEGFNIVAFGLTPRLLSISPLKATDNAKASARMWLDDIRPAGSADIDEALSFSYDLASRKTRIFLITNSSFINESKIEESCLNKTFTSLSIINGFKANQDAAKRIACSCSGKIENVNDPRDMGDALCRALSGFLLIPAENITVKTDKNVVWHKENQGKIYPWERLQLYSNSPVPLPERADISGYIQDGEFAKTMYFTINEDMGDTITAMYAAEQNKSESAVRISNKFNIPCPKTELALKVKTASQDSTIRFPAKDAEGGGSDNPGNHRKNALALLAMQSTNGSIGSPSETAGRLWEIMTSHSCPSIFILQIKKAVEYLFGYVQTGDYAILPERLLDVFDLWLEMFPSDSIFAKKLEALVYMNRK